MTHSRTNRLIAVALSTLILMVGSGCDDNPVKSDPQAPSIRMKESPVNQGIEQPLSLTLIWSSVDPDGDSLLHDVYFGTALLPVLVASDLVDTNYTATGLDHATKYYWRIVARDSTGRQATTGTRSFTTFSWVYPLAVGNRWDYSDVLYTWTSYLDRPTVLVPDTVEGHSHVFVSDMDTLFDSLPTYDLRAVLVQDSVEYYSDAWFNNVDDGLFLYAFNGAGSMAVPLKIKPGYTFSLLGQQFNSLGEIVAAIKQPLTFASASQNDFYLEDTPVKSLQYPLTIGSQWTVRTTGNPWRIDKIVTRQEQIEVPAGQFNAFQIRWLYDLDANGIWDEEITIVDHIADVGLVQRVISVSGVEVYYEWGEPAGFADYTTVIRLTGYSID